MRSVYLVTVMGTCKGRSVNIATVLTLKMLWFQAQANFLGNDRDAKKVLLTLKAVEIGPKNNHLAYHVLVNIFDTQGIRKK